MESAYVLAMRELEEIRRENNAILEYRKSEAARLAPEISEIDKELVRAGSALLKTVLEKSENFAAVKKKIQGLQARKIELLRKNGFEEDYLDDIFSCEKCRDTGFIGGHRCDCLKALIVKNLGANANLTEYMKNQTFENFDFSLFEDIERDGKTVPVKKIMRRAVEICMDFSENFQKDKQNLILSGNAGTGKTYLSSCIANRVLSRGKTVYYTSAYKLFEMLEAIKFGKETFGADETTARYVYDVDLLIIDDLGTEFMTQFTSAAFFDIVNSRLISGKSTVISTNLGLEGITDLYSQRVSSRIMGDYKAITLLGSDVRPKLKK